MDTKEKKRTGISRSGSKTARERSAAKRRPSSANTSNTKKQTAAKAELPKKRTVSKPKTSVPTPDVVYTPAKPFSRNRFLLRLATVAAVVVALVFGMSLFLKVDTIMVSGANKYTAYMVSQASGIEMGDGLLTLNDARISGKITTNLPYVESASIAIQLPGTVIIQITEMDVVYSIRDSSDAWWLITSEGKVVTKTDSAEAGEYTKILGITLQNPEAGKQCQAADVMIGTGTGSEQSMSGSSRLSAALSIVQYLEGRNIIGEMASVDVSDLTNIELWYGQRYQVKLGDTTELGYKISLMDAAVNGENGLKDYDSGVLDITLKTQNGVIYIAFE